MRIGVDGWGWLWGPSLLRSEQSEVEHGGLRQGRVVWGQKH